MQYTKFKEQFPLLLGWGIALVVILSALFAWNSKNLESTRTVYATLLEKKRVIDQMRIFMAKSIEMEKNAVMALTDQESMEYAKQSRAASDTVAQNLITMRALISAAPNEQKLLDEFTTCWTELGKVDQDILQLAVENTNLKAAALSREKGGEIMQRFESALDAIRASLKDSPREGEAAALASRAMIAALKILNLHGPHIIETDEKKMDQLEARMTTEEAAARQSLAALEEVLAPAKPESLVEAKADFAELMALTSQVVKLSRQNSNIKSLELSMGRKRIIAAQCDEVLAALQEAVKQTTYRATK
jgi:hypothetical protein